MRFPFRPFRLLSPFHLALLGVVLSFCAFFATAQTAPAQAKLTSAEAVHLLAALPLHFESSSKNENWD